MRFTFFILLFAASAQAQPVVAPTSEPAGTARGEDWSGYNIVDSVELGYRFRTIGGNLDKYRSDVNFGDGIRLLGSSFTMHSKDGHGRFFDEVVLNTQGLGNDPYESATFRVQKNGLYRYDLMWRENAYFNPGLTTGNSAGQHLLDTTYDLQDHDLTLFPQAKVKFFLGYTRGSQTGAALSTTQLFDSRGNEFPFFANTTRRRNEYRVGNEISLLGVRLNWTRGWEDFKEDTPFDLTAPSAGNNPVSRTTLSAFQRREPYHGTSPYWRVALFSEKKLFAMNGRFTYTAGARDFVLNESAVGTNRFGSEANRQVLTFGDGRRPVATGNFTLSVFPTSKLTITNHTSIYNVRTEGDSTFLQYDNSAQSANLLYFNYLGIRTIANETQANLQATSWLGFYAGYQYSNRFIRSIEQSAFPQSPPDAIQYDQTNRQHSGLIGMRLRPAKGLTLTLDGEVGRADQPFTAVSDQNYYMLGAKLSYKRKAFQFSAASRANYNTNSVSLSTYSSHARTYSANASWTPLEWFSIDAGYSKLHLNTVGGLAYFLNSRLIRGDQSYYFSNLHAGNLGARFSLPKRADIYVGYSHVQDTGDGRDALLGGGIGSALPALEAAQTFPLTFQSPLARLSVRIHPKIRFNLGFQYYGYHEQFYNTRNYRANTGFTSVLWSF